MKCQEREISILIAAPLQADADLYSHMLPCRMKAFN